jgi:trehalose synthase
MPVHLEEVHVAPLPVDRFREVLPIEDWQEFVHNLEIARGLFDGRAVLNVNSTAAGGGVAEMLRSFVSYGRGAGIDIRWLVMAGHPEFFRITKRLHNFLHGVAGDGGDLGPQERAVYEQVMHDNAEQLVAALRPEDVVLLHDPQTAGLADRTLETGATVLWRCHIGAEQSNDYVRRAWEFLSPYLEGVNACVFSRPDYVPTWCEGRHVEIIPPSIDVFSAKNQELEEPAVHAILAHVGLVTDSAPTDAIPGFQHTDGTPGRVDHMCEVLSTGPPPSYDAPLVVQVSRWDHLKDPVGVMQGFAEYAVNGTDAHLVLAGPTVHAVADDPEGAQVLDETVVAWRGLPHGLRARVHLACLPMLDVEENAAIVNALQRHAAVVVQKSLQEGFGLTVAEAMWKGRPVVASAVGGIQDQIEDGVTGFLVEDPTDLEAFGALTLALIKDPDLRHRIGAAARERVIGYFMENRHSMQYIVLLATLIAGREQAAGGSGEPTRSEA